MADKVHGEELSAVGSSKEALLRVEARILEGRELRPELLLAPYGSDGDRSPLLQLALGEHFIAEGSPEKAKPAFESAVKGLALLTWTDRLLAAMSGLARVHLRLGEMDQAETLLRFLREEYRRTSPEERGGGLVWALAEGAYLIGLEDPSAELLSEAVDRLESASDTGQACMALFAFLSARSFRLTEAEWTSVRWRLKRWSAGLPQAGEYGRLISACRSAREGREEEAWSVLSELAGGNQLPGSILAEAELELCRLSLRAASVPVPVRDSLLGRLASWDERHPGDLRLQYEALGVLLEWARLGRRIEEEKVYSSGLRSLGRILRYIPSDASGEEDAGRTAEHTEAGGETGGLWRVHLFGGLAFLRGSEQAAGLRWKRRKSLELFLYLILQPRYSCPKEKVLELFGEDEEPERASKVLYVLVHQLKRTLHEALAIRDAVCIREGFVCLREDAFDYVDAERFLALGRVADQIWTTDRPMAYEMYHEAYAQYGELLPEYPYMPWLADIRESFVQRMASILRRLLRLAGELKETGREDLYGQEWIRLQPYEEEAYIHRLRFLVREGRGREAERLSDVWLRVCREELGAAPSDDFLSVLEGGGA